MSSDPATIPVTVAAAFSTGAAIVTIGTSDSRPRITSETTGRRSRSASMKYWRSLIDGDSRRG